MNHSHAAIAKIKPVGASPCPRRAWKNKIVVKMLPTYTTNITGLRSCVKGASLRNESAIAGPTSFESNRRKDLRTTIFYFLQ